MAMNMGYCRWANTLAAMLECFDEDDPGQCPEFPEEQQARRSLLLLCQQVSDDYQDVIEKILEENAARRRAKTED